MLRISASCLFWLLSIASAVWAQSSPVTATEKAILVLEQKWLQAQKGNNPDLLDNPDLLAPLLAGDFAGTWRDGKVAGKTATRADAKTIRFDSAAQVDDWNALMAEADKLQTEGAYADAEKQFQRALSDAELFGPKDRRLALTVNNLGTLYRRQGKYKLAENNYNRALAIWTENGGPDTIALNNLAVLLVGQGRYAEAESKYRRAIISIEERKLGASDPLNASGAASLAPMLTNLGTLSFYQGRYPEAESLFRRAMAIQEKSGSNPASTLNNLAVLYRAEARYHDAERLFLRAQSIREKTLGPSHPEIAKILTNLADLHTKQRHFARAESTLRQAVSILEASVGTDSPDVASSLGTLAMLYAREKNFAAALPLQRRTLAIRQKAFGASHPRCGREPVRAVLPSTRRPELQ